MADEQPEQQQPQAPAAAAPVPPSSAITFTDLHDPSASSKFMIPGRDFDAVPTTIMVKSELAADAALRATTVVVAPPMGVSLQQTFDEGISGLRTARAEAGLQAFSSRMEVQLNSALFDQVAHGTLGVSLTGRDPDMPLAPPNMPLQGGGFLQSMFMQDMNARATLVIAPSNAEQLLRNPEIEMLSAPVKEETLALQREALSSSNFTVQHELAHAVSHHNSLRPTFDVPALESIADGAASYSIAMQGDENIGQRLQGLADVRALRIDNHALAADGLLQARHNLLADPEGMKQSIGALGTTVTGREQMMAADVLFDGPSAGFDRKYDAEIGLAVAQEVLSGQPISIPEDRLGIDAAVSLLRTQMAVERHHVNGLDNPLSQKMPELWDQNRAAFAGAQDYMRDQYGIGVSAPSLPERPQETQAPRPLMRPEPSL